MSEIAKGEWRVTAMPDSDQLLIETEDYVIAECNEVVEQDVTNFKAIVHCVNNHERLVDMVKQLDEIFCMKHGCFPLDRVTPDQVKFNHVMTKARTLLASLEAEKGGEL